MRMIGPVGSLALVLAMASGGMAAGAPVSPHDSVTTPLERAAFAALPAVYELRGEIRVAAVVAARRRVAINRTIPFRGTAFGVAPGHVVTARHLIRPSDATVLHELGALDLPNLPEAGATVRVVATPVTTVTLTRARSISECLDGMPVAIAATVVDETDANGDLALLQIADRRAPTLALDDSQTTDTPVAAIGFGDQQDAAPAIRRGTLAATAAIGRDDRFATLAIDVVRGDSGGPVIDGAGRSRGVVLRRQTESTAPVMAQAKSVRALLTRAGVDVRPSPTEALFRNAMAAFWARDYPLAERRLADQVGAYTDTVLVRCQRERAAALATTGYDLSGPSRSRGAILAIGATAMLAAMIFGVLRLRRHDAGD